MKPSTGQSGTSVLVAYVHQTPVNPKSFCDTRLCVCVRDPEVPCGLTAGHLAAAAISGEASRSLSESDRAFSGGLF